MTLSSNAYAHLEKEMQTLKSAGKPFAMATIVRTVDATSAKPGGKALLDDTGRVVSGWVGGGCARGAVGKAAREAIRSGLPQFISLRPQELLETEGVAPGELREGVRYARNGCPSQGTMDVFVEPVLPLPRLVICGTGLVALALADMGRRFDFDVALRVTPGTAAAAVHPDDVQEGFDLAGADFVVVATQGQGDADALRAAVASDAPYLSFVGSRKKFATLAARLTEENSKFSRRLAQIKAPAGLDISAITPDEIALSILAEITQMRRARNLTEPQQNA